MNFTIGSRGFTLERELGAAPANVWRALTEPDLVRRWWTPPPHSTPEVAIALVPGGRFGFLMRLADGSEIRQEACILLVEPERRLVWTDALSEGFRPKPEGFLTSDVTLAPSAAGSAYRAQILHKDGADVERHLGMGLESAWVTITDGLDAVAAAL